MKLSPEERRRRWIQFQKMPAPKKAEHIWMYYKIPLILLVCFAFLLASEIRNAVTQKSSVVYLAYLNISVGEDMDGYLSGGFVSYLGRDPEEEVYRYYNLYLSDNPSAENHQYAYTSNLKLLAAINAKQLDLVLMNKEAYDLCSANGYLLDLAPLYPSNDPSNADIQALITENLVIQEDNSIEYNLGEADSYTAVTQSVANAWNVSSLPQFQQAGFSGNVYLGIIANTPRLEMAKQYSTYLICDLSDF